MKVAITHPYTWPEVRRGAERIVRETARALAGRGHDVTIFTSSWKPVARRDGPVRVVRLKRIRHNAESHERDFGRRLLPQLVARRFDVVHALGVPDAVAAVRAQRVRRNMRTVYENLGIPIRSWWDRQPVRVEHERLVRDVDVYACMSQFALDVLERDYGRTGALIPGGVNLSQFQPAARRAERPTILFSGAITEPRKGVATLLAALALVARDVPDVQLWLSGPGDPSQLLADAPVAARERTEALGVGDPEAQGERYATAWATALPSTDDSFGMVLIESLASGTPVIGADHSAVPELVTDETGALSEPGDPESLAAACVRALELSQRPGTAERCRSFAAAYDWDTGMAPRLEKLYAGSSTG